jgi:6-pyruvoyltetrahydropterin/6-carboxytetrahydropterin synthase
MYTLAVQRDFIARHFLVGGDWGPENLKHSHHYRVEVELSGLELDERGYLVDLVDLEAQLEALVSRYRDRTLNDLPEFAGLNPSLEHLARLFCQQLRRRLNGLRLRALKVKIWETDQAWAAYRLEVEEGCGGGG